MAEAMTQASELRSETFELLATLSDEQVLLVLAYARCLKDGATPLTVHGLEDLLEERA
jgi:hypothetical protein